MAKWCMASLAVHLGMLALMLEFTVNRVKHTPPVSIDFTLGSSPRPEQLRGKSTPPVAAPKQPIAPQKLPAVAAQPTPRKQAQTQPESQPTPVVSQNAAPTPSAPLASRTVTENVSRQVSTNQGIPVVAAAPRTAQTSGGGMTPEKAQQRYLNEHFTYIRDLIVKRLSYPLVARRMGWSGRVVLVFIVAEDGSVRSIQVKESSGYPALDNSAMETVKSVAPFPRPPAAAEIVMPVQFQLR
ncbi:energy transducer TonB [Geotalea uraniireducens]|nr:energy transducer TonB [Geotalea uraniireducens]